MSLFEIDSSRGWSGTSDPPASVSLVPGLLLGTTITWLGFYFENLHSYCDHSLFSVMFQSGTGNVVL